MWVVAVCQKVLSNIETHYFQPEHRTVKYLSSSLEQKNIKQESRHHTSFQRQEKKPLNIYHTSDSLPFFFKLICWMHNVLTGNRKQRWLLAFKKTNQNAQEVKNARFLISTRQNNVQMFSIRHLDKATNRYQTQNGDTLSSMSPVKIVGENSCPRKDRGLEK